MTIDINTLIRQEAESLCKLITKDHMYAKVEDYDASLMYDPEVSEQIIKVVTRLEQLIKETANTTS